MLSKKSSNGRGLDLLLEEGETKEEILEHIVLAAIKKAFASQGLTAPKTIDVAKYIFTGSLREGEVIVKPFWIKGVEVPLFIKATDSPTKILIAPVFGLCPSVIKSMIQEISPEHLKVDPTLIKGRIIDSPIPATPFGVYPESLH